MTCAGIQGGKPMIKPRQGIYSDLAQNLDSKFLTELAQLASVCNTHSLAFEV
jgi:hypothetical protein